MSFIKCDDAKRLGDYTLKSFEGETAANKYWEDLNSIQMEPRNYYNSDFGCLESNVELIIGYISIFGIVVLIPINEYIKKSESVELNLEYMLLALMKIVCSLVP